VSHFIEHVLFKGTKRRTAREISQAVEGIGGYLNAFTSEENTCFYAKARHDHFPELLEVLADMFLHSTFDPVEIDKEREVIKEELAMCMDQPQQYVQELLNATLWPDQPLGRCITGTEKTLDGLGRAQLVDYQRQNYVAPATLLAAGGRITHREMVVAAAKHARQFTRGPRPHCAAAVTAQTKPALCLLTRKTEQTQIALGIRACSRHDERRFVLRLLNAVLGENMSSRLFQTVREDHGLAYSIYSASSFFDDAGDIVIAAGLDTGNLNKTLRLIVREMNRLANQLVPPAEMRRARDYLVGQLDLSLENSENQMMWAAEQWLNYGKIAHPDEVKSRLCAVTAPQVRAAARELFRPDRYNLALISPLKTVAGLEMILAG
jgi:predicted Zn-dependent peptidase